MKFIPNSVLTPDLSVGSVQGAGNIQLSASMYAGGDNTNQAYSGAISGIGGVTKMGTGTWTILGSNTYTGPTAVVAGHVANRQRRQRGFHREHERREHRRQRHTGLQPLRSRQRSLR